MHDRRVRGVEGHEQFGDAFGGAHAVDGVDEGDEEELSSDAPEDDETLKASDQVGGYYYIFASLERL